MKLIDQILQESIKYKPQQRFSEIKPFLEFLIKKNQLGHALEIGSADGGLTYILSEIFEMVVAIDINHTAIYSKDNIVRMYPSDGCISYYQPYDLIFIDGDHSYEGVKNDYYIYNPLLSDNGVLAFHDIKNTEVQQRDNCKVYDFLQDRMLFLNTKIFNEFTDEWGGLFNPEMKNHGGLKIYYD